MNVPDRVGFVAPNLRPDVVELQRRSQAIAADNESRGRFCRL